MLTGLAPGLAYDFRFFASSSGAREAQITQYVLVGSGEPESGLLTTPHGTLTPNTQMMLSFHGIRPNEFGEIFVDLQPVESSDTPIGIMEITVVPEPASLVSFVVGVLLLSLSLRKP